MAVKAGMSLGKLDILAGDCSMRWVNLQNSGVFHTKTNPNQRDKELDVTSKLYFTVQNGSCHYPLGRMRRGQLQPRTCPHHHMHIFPFRTTQKEY